MSYTLKGQVALVTGASSGIGRGIAGSMAAAGATVAINHIGNDEDARKVAEDIKKDGGNASIIEADVSREGDVTRMFSTIIDRHGTVDILVNNAGIQKDSPFADMSLDDWNAVIGVDLTGAFLCSREAVKEFTRRGVQPEFSRAAGKIIFISSVHEIIPWAGHANYTAAKGGVQMLMKTIAQELAPKKIRANCIAPGAIKTPINQKVWSDPEQRKKLESLIPYDRIGETSDIGPIAAWLASDEADYITGTTVYADGGMLLYPGFRTGG
jgi:glucose 1-dehydrogenase